MATLEELETDLAKVRTELAAPRDVTFPDKSHVEVHPIPDLLAAEASLLRRIAELQGATVHTIAIHSTKGLES